MWLLRPRSICVSSLTSCDFCPSSLACHSSVCILNELGHFMLPGFQDFVQIVPSLQDAPHFYSPHPPQPSLDHSCNSVEILCPWRLLPWLHLYSMMYLCIILLFSKTLIRFTLTDFSFYLSDFFNWSIHHTKMCTNHGYVRMNFYKMNSPMLLPIQTKTQDIGSTPEIHLCLLPITAAFKVTTILTSAIRD